MSGVVMCGMMYEWVKQKMQPHLKITGFGSQYYSCVPQLPLYSSQPQESGVRRVRRVRSQESQESQDCIALSDVLTTDCRHSIPAVAG